MLVSNGHAHTTMFNSAFCDGSVHPISYDIDIAVHQALGSRNGGESVDDAVAVKHGRLFVFRNTDVRMLTSANC